MHGQPFDFERIDFKAHVQNNIAIGFLSLFLMKNIGTSF